jgi:hypothetical protein
MGGIAAITAAGNWRLARIPKMVEDFGYENWDNIPVSDSSTIEDKDLDYIFDLSIAEQNQVFQNLTKEQQDKYLVKLYCKDIRKYRKEKHYSFEKIKSIFDKSIETKEYKHLSECKPLIYQAIEIVKAEEDKSWSSIEEPELEINTPEPDEINLENKLSKYLYHSACSLKIEGLQEDKISKAIKEINNEFKNPVCDNELKKILDKFSKADPFTQSKNKNKIIVYNAQYALKDHPPIDWIIEGLIAENTLTIFYGEPGSKKTYSLIDLAICVAMGKQWCGFNVKKGNVLFVNEEVGNSFFTRRVSRVLNGENGDENTPISYVSSVGFSLNNDESVIKLKSLIEEVKPILLIIDSFSCIAPGDENSKKDVQIIMSALKDVKNVIGITIAVIHHTDKNGNNYRGSSSIKDNSDLMVEVKSDNDSRIINFTTTKEREIEPMKWASTIIFEDNKVYFEKCDFVDKLPPSQSDILQFAIFSGSFTKSIIDNGTNHKYSDKTIRNALSTFQQNGKIIVLDSGGGHKETIYQVVNKNENNE